MTIRKLKILVVDDEEIIRAVFDRLLKSTPHLVGLAENGRRAVEILKEEQFDLIFVDAKMRDDTGCSLVERLLGLREKAAIVVMLGFSNPEVDGELRSAEPFAWLSKPFTIDEILRIIEKASLSGRVRPSR